MSLSPRCSRACPGEQKSPGKGQNPPGKGQGGIFQGYHPLPSHPPQKTTHPHHSVLALGQRLGRVHDSAAAQPQVPHPLHGGGGGQRDPPPAPAPGAAPLGPRGAAPAPPRPTPPLRPPIGSARLTSEPAASSGHRPAHGWPRDPRLDPQAHGCPHDSRASPRVDPKTHVCPHDP